MVDRKYDVKKLRELTKKYMDRDVLVDWGLDFGDVSTDNEIIDKLRQLEEHNPGILLSLKKEIQNVERSINDDLKLVTGSMSDLSSQLDKIAREREITEDHPLIKEWQKKMNEYEELTKHRDHVRTFLFHINVAIDEARGRSKRRRPV